MAKIWMPERLPEDIASERSLLATCCAPGMETRAIEVFSLLDEHDFVVPQHKALFRVAALLANEGQEINALTLRDRLETVGLLGSVGGFAGLTELLASEEVGRPEVLARILKRKRQFRQLIKTGAMMIREAYEEVQTSEQVARAGAEQALQAVEDAMRPVGHPEAVGTLLSAFLDERLKNPEVDPGIQTGIPDLDHATGGLHAGNLVILAARPGLGKTAMALQWARKAAHNGKRVGFWTLEMTQDEVFDRIVASVSPDLTSGWARGRKLSDHDFAQAYSARDYLMDLPLNVCADGAVTVPHVRLAAMKAKAQGKPYDLIAVDYLQLLSSAQGEHHDNEAVRVSRISRALKLLAKELDIPIVVLCQLNREIEHGNGRRPRLADLRDSGAIEQDADAVVFIHRTHDANKPQTHGELVIAKNRHGMLRTIPIDFDGAHMRFVQLTLETDSPYGGAPSSKPHQQPVL